MEYEKLKRKVLKFLSELDGLTSTVEFEQKNDYINVRIKSKSNEKTTQQQRAYGKSEVKRTSQAVEAASATIEKDDQSA